MLAKNYVEVRGFLATDPEVHITTNGTKIATGRVAVARPVSADQRRVNAEAGESNPTDFFNYRLFNQQVENLIEKAGLAKGDLVSIEGSLRTDTWKDATGAYHERTFVNANRIDILRRKNATPMVLADAEEAANAAEVTTADVAAEDELEALATASTSKA